MSDGRIFVAEITVVVDANGTEETFYFSTAPFTTSPSDTPANKPIQALLKNPGSMRYDLFSQGRLTGLVTPNYGIMSLANPYDANGKGVLDDWINYGVSNGKVTLRIGTPGDAYPSAWKTVYIARVYKIVVSEEVQITLRDRSQLLNKPVITDVFTGSGGPEGTGAGAGRKKAIVTSGSFFIPPILINTQKQIYFVQANGDGGLRPFSKSNDNVPEFGKTFDVYDNGIRLDTGEDYASFEEMEAVSPPEGFVRYYYGTDSVYATGWKNGPIYFRTGSPPAGELRVQTLGYPNDTDFVNENSATGSWTANLMLYRAGFTPLDVESTDLYLGLGEQYIYQDETFLQILSNACVSPQGYFGFTRLDKFRTGYLLDPDNADFYAGTPNSLFGSPRPVVETTSLFTFTEENYRNLQNQPVPGQEIPVWSVTVNCFNTFPISEVAGGANDYIRDQLTREPYFVSFKSYSDTTRIANPNAENVEIEVTSRDFVNDFEIKLFSYRYFHLYGGNPKTFTIETELRDDLLDLELHDVVTLQTARFGLSAGVKTRIIGMEIDCVSRVMKFTLWIPGRGQFTGNTSPLEPGSEAYNQNQQTKQLVNKIGKVQFPSFTLLTRGNLALTGVCSLDYPAFSTNYAENPTPSGTTTGTPVTARSAFNSKFTTLSVYDFEGLTTGSEVLNTFTINSIQVNTRSVFYVKSTGDVDTELALDVRDDTIFSRFNTTSGGANYIESILNCGYTVDSTPMKTIRFEFVQPISIFGFYGTDFGDFSTGNIIARLTKLDNSTSDHIITSASRTDSNLIFWGFVDGQNEYSKVEIMIDPSLNVSMSDEFLGIDDIVFGPKSAVIGVENCTGPAISKSQVAFPSFTLMTAATLTPPIPDPTWASKSLGSSGATNLSRKLFAYNGSRLVLGTYEVSGINYARMYYSDDQGETWSVTTTLTNMNQGSLDYNGTAFVMHAAGNTCLRSTDGATWSTVSLPASDHLFLSAVGSVFIITADTSRPVRSTDNGLTFSTVTTYTTTSSNTSTWAVGTSTKMLTAGSTTTSGAVWVSTDNGVNWTRTTTGLPWGSSNPPLALAYSPTADRFVATNNSSNIFYSTDGTTWTTVGIGVNAKTVIFGNGLFVAFSDTSNDIAYSFDGISWTTRTNDLTGGAHSMISVSSSKLVAVDFGTSINSVSVGTY